jgi:hypothetical protein
LSFSAAGCSSNTTFDYVPVSGKVTYEDGTTFPGGQLQFSSQADPIGTAHPRPGTASINQDGTFDVVTSHKYGDGLVSGKHKVSFIFATDAEGRLLVPKEYASMATTPLVIDTADAPIEIKIPKPN